MRRASFILLTASLSLGSMACEPDLGECAVETQADDVVFSETGTPMFAGQALVYVSCSNGGFCHSPNASERARAGAPGGLDFDVFVGCDSDVEDCDAESAVESLERLLANQKDVADFDHDILRTLQDGSMPPGSAGDITGGATFYRTFTLGGEFEDPLPPITSREGREIVSEWLGCGARTVEIARVPADSTEPPGSRCDDQVGGRICRIAAVLPPPEPQWGGDDGIYNRAIVSRGCLACHRDDGNPNWGPDDQELDLCLSTPPESGDCDPAAVLTALTGTPAGAPACAGTGDLIVPGMADSSVFFDKLTAAPSCGDPMPLRSGSTGLPMDFLTPIRQWIQDGAMP